MISVCAYMDINGGSKFYTREVLEESLVPPYMSGNAVIAGFNSLVMASGYIELLRCGPSSFVVGKEGKWSSKKNMGIYRSEETKGKLSKIVRKKHTKSTKQKIGEAVLAEIERRGNIKVEMGER